MDSLEYEDGLEPSFDPKNYAMVPAAFLHAMPSHQLAGMAERYRLAWIMAQEQVRKMRADREWLRDMGLFEGDGI